MKTKLKRFDKTKSINENYLPIYANNSFTMVNLDCCINSLKELHGFCSCNCLSAGRIAKLQGGYYILNDSNQWEFLSRALGLLTFRELYNKLKHLKQKDEN